ncbi:unnamed protein product [Acanthoscelides obtectus]|uniref:Intraflagellar transport protein 20 n=1 Tax=Acanthoscelides obtectus TaxID=200917 RepID=A0A9P0K365_ACAOB|nr:unnamed protein product [Acanthoscelides obtectus]CAK1622636.1 Intraflagellar transport protein 20 homolog [Acanthoscelides obtectus]
MAESLAKSGIYFNEIDKICILDPEVSKQTHDLKDECQVYTEKTEEFQKLAGKFITLLEQLSESVEKQKIRAIGARNILHHMEKTKENSHHQLQALIAEKSIELERLKIQLNSLHRTEMEQNEIINKLTHC